MKWFGSRRRRGSGPVSAGMESREDVMDQDLADFTMDELREFLEADLVEVHADPGFKERLRRSLWDLVQTRAGERPIDPPRGGK